jgi:formylmethanofuran dehydrogenase subunit E
MRVFTVSSTSESSNIYALKDCDNTCVDGIQVLTVCTVSCFL